MFPSWRKFLIPSMKTLIKQSRKAKALGIQISSTLGTSLLSSNLEITTLGKVRNEEELALEFAMLFHSLIPSRILIHICACMLKPSMIDFDIKISNLCFPWIYPHNVHHTKAMESQY